MTLTALWNAFIACIFTLTCVWPGAQDLFSEKAEDIAIERIKNLSVNETRFEIEQPPIQNRTFSGDYLVSRYAQNNHDWNTASQRLNKAFDKLEEETKPEEKLLLLNRIMVLALGDGDYETARTYAQKIYELPINILSEEKTNKASTETEEDSEETITYLPVGKTPLATFFLAVDALKSKDYDKVYEYTEKLEKNGLYNFLSPLIISWTKAAQGEYDIRNLDNNVIHFLSAVKISHFLDKTSDIEPLLNKLVTMPQLGLTDYEGIGDAYTSIGKSDVALKIYQSIEQAWPENRTISHKIDTLKKDPAHNFFELEKSPAQGIADALFQMASILTQTDNDDSARVFIHTALFLDESLDEARLLLGMVLSDNQKYDAAIKIYKQINKDSPRYLEAQRLAASLLSHMGKTNKAVKDLQSIFEQHDDIESLILIGDLERLENNHKEAISAYNKAEKVIDSDGFPPQYWQIYYVRGMSYEQTGQWDMAEKDLLKALDYQPNHPLILNYLGYSWADQGKNLEKALDMIHKALSQRPNDGYITDSLGWALFRVGRYDESVPHLERAVQLLPYDPIINDHLGDAYWRVGRKLEARFQWLRAINHTEPGDDTSPIKEKLNKGLPSETPPSETVIKSASQG